MENYRIVSIVNGVKAESSLLNDEDEAKAWADRLNELGGGTLYKAVQAYQEKSSWLDCPGCPMKSSGDIS